MQAIRQIHHVTSNSLTIPLPTSFYNREVEVILLSLPTTSRLTAGKQLTPRLKSLSKRGTAFAEVNDAVSWQKQQRAERKLPKIR